MRISLKTFFVSIALGSAMASASVAAPVPGFETLYAAALTACGPTGSVEACTAAINAYSGAVVAAGVDPAVALVSFTELRTEVAAAGGTPEIAALFEELLPESGSVGPQGSPV